MSTWAYDLSGRCFRIDGRSIMIDEQLTEIEITHLAQRQALTRAHYMDTGERLLMKIRYEWILFFPDSIKSYILLIEYTPNIQPESQEL